MKIIPKFCILLTLLLPACANMGPNDGLVPRMSAQANLPYVPVLSSNGMLSAAPGGGSTVSPLAETRKAYWNAQ